MNEFLKKKLQVLADEYETKSFYKDDPSKFLCQNKCAADTELLSFIAAMLSFGNRKQFIPKIQFIKNLSEKKGGSYKWISSKAFMEDFPCGKEKFYRFYSFDDMQDFFMELWKIITSQEKLSSQKERPGTKNEYSQKDALSEKAAISAKDALSEKVTSQDKVLPSTEIALEPSLPKSQNFLPLEFVYLYH